MSSAVIAVVSVQGELQGVFTHTLYAHEWMDAQDDPRQYTILSDGAGNKAFILNPTPKKEKKP